MWAGGGGCPAKISKILKNLAEIFFVRLVGMYTLPHSNAEEERLDNKEQE